MDDDSVDAMHQDMHAGRIEVEIGAARMLVTGAVDPALASAIAAALRGGR